MSKNLVQYWRIVVLLVLVGSCQGHQTIEGPANTEAGVGDEANLPNIVLMVADDHGKDALGCYGNPVVQTPNLDALAGTGTIFNRAFCTTASCSASRSVILTGLHNHANGHYGHQHSYHHFSSFDDVKSLPVLLEEAGYRTARIGKYHVAPESVYQFQSVFQVNPRSAVEMADSVQNFIQLDDPFFLYFCFSDPHRGGGFAEELPHQPDRFGNIPKSYPGITEINYDPAEVLVPPHLTDTPETRAEIAQYYQSISRLDQGVGKLMNYLKATGKFDNTLIVYISDNGMAFPGAKTTLYEAGMQLPCIVKWPGQKSPASTDEMINWTDLTPTFLEAANTLKADSLFHGRSFLPLQDGGTLDRGEIYASHTFHEVTMYYPMRVVREDKYKLIMNLAHGLEYPFASDLYASKTWQSLLAGNFDKLGDKPIEAFLKRPQYELYDLEQDPHETINLAKDKAYNEILTGLQRKIKSFQTLTNDPWLYKWEYE